VRYWTLAAVTVLSAYAVFALAGSALGRFGAAALAPRTGRLAPARRARLFFRLRILPGLGAATAAFGIALPIFLWFEDSGTTEAVSRTLGVIAAAGAGLLLHGGWRAASAWRSTARVLAEWERRGRRLERAVDGIDAPVPAFAIDGAFPIVALVGVRRPRLFIAERVLRDCSPEELAVMVAHECAHVSARDNLKRLLIRACPAAFGVACLDRAWSAAAEEAADARAAGADPRARLALAEALIHIARLAVPQVPPLASAFYLGGSVDDRVRRLVEPGVERAASRWSRLALPVALAVLAAWIVVAAPALHALMEQAVRLLP
jgi:Zn-dependent protease with chaperone function